MDTGFLIGTRFLNKGLFQNLDKSMSEALQNPENAAIAGHGLRAVPPSGSAFDFAVYGILGYGRFSERGSSGMKAMVSP